MYKEGERSMAWIARIAETKSIPDADKIEVYRIGGWWVVDQKDRYKVGDVVIYVSIDSWIPTEIAPFLTRGDAKPREYNGVRGELLRTVKLRGALSQGLLLPLSIFDSGHHVELPCVGEDVTEVLGIQKWEAPIPACLSGQVKGAFPSYGRKTDQERCQNLVKEIQQAYDNDIQFEVTTKLDGSSCTVGTSLDGEYIVCSRNMSLKTEQEGNTFVDVCRKHNLEEKTKDIQGLLISGEIMGPGIQKNQEKLKEHDIFVFDIYDIAKGEYVDAETRQSICESLELNHVPVLHTNVTLKELGLKSVDDILKFADGPSLNAAKREGVVFKSVDGSFSFKAISNSWLIKNDG